MYYRRGPCGSGDLAPNDSLGVIRVYRLTIATLDGQYHEINREILLLQKLLVSSISYTRSIISITLSFKLTDLFADERLILVSICINCRFFINRRNRRFEINFERL